VNEAKAPDNQERTAQGCLIGTGDVALLLFPRLCWSFCRLLTFAMLGWLDYVASASPLAILSVLLYAALEAPQCGETPFMKDRQLPQNGLYDSSP